MKNAVKLWVVAALLLASAPLYAQGNGRVLTLDEALSLTMTNNPALEAAAHEERAALQERRAAIGLRMPKVNLVGAYTYLGKDIGFDFNDLKGPFGKFAGGVLNSGLISPELIPPIQELLTPMLNADWSLTLQNRSFGFVGGEVTMPLFLGGKINAANRAAKINYQSAGKAGDQTRNALVSELVERYYGLALATQVVDVRQSVVKGVRHHLNDAIALEKNGMIAHSERLYVEFKMSEAERELSNAKLQMETISSALNNTLGEHGAFTPITSMFILTHIEGLDYYQQMAERQNPLLQQVDLKRKLAIEATKVQRADFMPQVVAMGGGSVYNYQVTGLVPRWAVGVGLNFKIFDGLNREFKYSASKQTVKRVKALQTKAEMDIAVLVERLYNQMNNYANQISSIDASIAFAEEYLKVKRAAFLEGMSSSTDLIDAELNLAKVRTERMQAAYQYDVLLAKLLETAGASNEFAAYMRRTDARQITFDKE